MFSIFASVTLNEVFQSLIFWHDACHVTELSDISMVTKKSASKKKILSQRMIDSGEYISPKKRISLYSADEWEDFTEEWVFYLKKEYENVERLGQAGDQGRDIVATMKGGVWDNYQCKHYKSQLKPSNVYSEVGKIIYYSFLGEFTPPNKNFFVSPQGAGPTLFNLLNDSNKLKEAMKDNWDKYCKAKITSTKEILLKGLLRKYFCKFDFSIFKGYSVLKLIDNHRNTPYYIKRFGGGLQDRPEPELPSDDIQVFEKNYIKAMLEAFSEDKGINIDLDNIVEYASYLDRLERARVNFYSAESLNRFSRDYLPPGTYDDLLNEFYEAVYEVWNANYKSGYKRMNEVMKAIPSVQLSHILFNIARIQDKKGMCHQITNKGKVVWINEE